MNLELEMIRFWAAPLWNYHFTRKVLILRFTLPGWVNPRLCWVLTSWSTTCWNSKLMLSNLVNPNIPKPAKNASKLINWPILVINARLKARLRLNLSDSLIWPWMRGLENKGIVQNLAFRPKRRLNKNQNGHRSRRKDYKITFFIENWTLFHWIVKHCK